MASRKRAPVVLDEGTEAEVARRVATIKEATSLEALQEAIASFAGASGGGDEICKHAARRIDWTRLPSFGGKRPEGEGIVSWDRMQVLAGDSLEDLRLAPRQDLTPASQSPDEEQAREPSTTVAAATAHSPAGRDPDLFATQLRGELEGHRLVVAGLTVKPNASGGAKLLVRLEGDSKAATIDRMMSPLEWGSANATELAGQIAEAQKAG